MDKMTDIWFAGFFIVWILSRLVYYPAVIIRTALFEVPECPQIQGKRITLMYSFDTLLVLLLMMHVYWTYLIAKIIKKALFSTGAVDDIREDSDSD